MIEIFPLRYRNTRTIPCIPVLRFGVSILSGCFAEQNSTNICIYLFFSFSIDTLPFSRLILIQIVKNELVCIAVLVSLKRKGLPK